MKIGRRVHLRAGDRKRATTPACDAKAPAAMDVGAYALEPERQP